MSLLITDNKYKLKTFSHRQYNTESINEQTAKSKAPPTYEIDVAYISSVYGAAVFVLVEQILKIGLE